MSQNKSTVFLSYSSSDKQFVLDFKKQLESKGHTVIFDDDNLTPGESIPDFILKSIRGSNATICIITRKSLLSPWVARETINTFHSQNWSDKKFIACYLEDDFLKSSFRADATRLVDIEIEEINTLIQQHNELRIDTNDINQKKSRLHELRNDLGEILRKLNNSLCLDFRKESFDNSFQRLIEYLEKNSKNNAQLEKQIINLQKQAINQDKKPYPGMKPFDLGQDRYYFGRERQIQEVLNKFKQAECRFVIVSGASGSGKSSLIKAGALPKLTDPKQKRFVYMRPGDNGEKSNPFLVLANKIGSLIPGQPYPNELAQKWEATPSALAISLKEIDHPPECLLLDQMEELFTICPEQCLASFIEALFIASENGLIILASIRSDYLPRCEDHPRLHKVLLDHHYVNLWKLSKSAILDMIRKPAELVGLDVNAIADTLAEDTEENPGNLPLLAHALEKLWENREGKRLSLEAYFAFGGIHGVVGVTADAAFQELVGQIGAEQADVAFHNVFSKLVRVNIEGIPTRNVARLSEIPSGNAQELITIFSDWKFRLLSLGDNLDESESTVEVSHEALFKAWPKLEAWIGLRRNDERELALAERDADAWAKKAYDPIRLELIKILDARKAMNELGKSSNELHETTIEYLYPGERLKSMLNLPLNEVNHQQRAKIGDLLDSLQVDDRPGIGVDTDGLPESLSNSEKGYWIRVPSGTITLIDDGVETVNTVNEFYIARLPVTQGQYKAFIKASDGYSNPSCWIGGIKPENPCFFLDDGDNKPVTSCAWVEAVAYCNWINKRLKAKGNLPEGKVIRLPTESEWQQAASGGRSNGWPWGTVWGNGPANTIESRIGRICAAGLFHEGASPDGAMDMAGNVWEWCIDKTEDLTSTIFSANFMSYGNKNDLHPLRGGSHGYGQDSARVNFRRRFNDGRYPLFGFRLCLSST